MSMDYSKKTLVQSVFGDYGLSFGYECLWNDNARSIIAHFTTITTLGRTKIELLVLPHRKK